MYEKYLLRSLIVVVLWGILVMPKTVLGQYTFGDWARDHGYSPGDVMPIEANASSYSSSAPNIDSLDGIGEYCAASHDDHLRFCTPQNQADLTTAHKQPPPARWFVVSGGVV